MTSSEYPCVFSIQHRDDIIGILKMPTYPAQFYAGRLNRTSAGSNSGYAPADNSKGYFVTMEDAREQIRIYPTMMRLRIVGVAIKFANGGMEFALSPACHNDLRNEHEQLLLKAKRDKLAWVEGFITNYGSFVDRRLARKIASSACQLADNCSNSCELTSSDLKKETFTDVT